MTASWSEISNTPQFKQLPPEKQKEYAESYLLATGQAPSYDALYGGAPSPSSPAQVPQQQQQEKSSMGEIAYSGLEGTMANMTRTAADLTAYAGMENATAYLMQKHRNLLESSGDVRLGQESLKDVKGVSDFAEYGWDRTLQSIPGILVDYGLPVLGGAIGSVVPGVGTVGGAAIGTGLSSLLSGVDAYGSHLTEQDERGIYNPEQALAGAVAQAALDRAGVKLSGLLPGNITGNVMQTGLRPALGSIGKAAAAEGVTGAAGEGIAALAGGERDAGLIGERMLEGAATGASTGVHMSGAKAAWVNRDEISDVGKQVAATAKQRYTDLTKDGYVIDGAYEVEVEDYLKDFAQAKTQAMSTGPDRIIRGSQDETDIVRKIMKNQRGIQGEANMSILQDAAAEGIPLEEQYMSDSMKEHVGTSRGIMAKLSGLVESVGDPASVVQDEGRITKFVEDGLIKITSDLANQTQAIKARAAEISRNITTRQDQLNANDDGTVPLSAENVVRINAEIKSLKDSLKNANNEKIVVDNAMAGLGQTGSKVASDKMEAFIKAEMHNPELNIVSLLEKAASLKQIGHRVTTVKQTRDTSVARIGGQPVRSLLGGGVGLLTGGAVGAVTGAAISKGAGMLAGRGRRKRVVEGIKSATQGQTLNADFGDFSAPASAIDTLQPVTEASALQQGQAAVTGLQTKQAQAAQQAAIDLDTWKRQERDPTVKNLRDILQNELNNGDISQQDFDALNNLLDNAAKTNSKSALKKIKNRYNTVHGIRKKNHSAAKSSSTTGTLTPKQQQAQLDFQSNRSDVHQKAENDTQDFINQNSNYLSPAQIKSLEDAVDAIGTATQGTFQTKKTLFNQTLSDVEKSISGLKAQDTFRSARDTEVSNAQTELDSDLKNRKISQKDYNSIKTYLDNMRNITDKKTYGNVLSRYKSMLKTYKDNETTRKSQAASQVSSTKAKQDQNDFETNRSTKFDTYNKEVDEIINGDDGDFLDPYDYNNLYSLVDEVGNANKATLGTKEHAFRSAINAARRRIAAGKVGKKLSNAEANFLGDRDNYVNNVAQSVVDNLPDNIPAATKQALQGMVDRMQTVDFANKESLSRMKEAFREDVRLANRMSNEAKAAQTATAASDKKFAERDQFVSQKKQALKNGSLKDAANKYHLQTILDAISKSTDPDNIARLEREFNFQASEVAKSKAAKDKKKQRTAEDNKRIANQQQEVANLRLDINEMDDLSFDDLNTLSTITDAMALSEDNKDTYAALKKEFTSAKNRIKVRNNKAKNAAALSMSERRDYERREESLQRLMFQGDEDRMEGALSRRLEEAEKASDVFEDFKDKLTLEQVKLINDLRKTAENMPQEDQQLVASIIDNLAGSPDKKELSSQIGLLQTALNQKDDDLRRILLDTVDNRQRENNTAGTSGLGVMLPFEPVTQKPKDGDDDKGKGKKTPPPTKPSKGSAEPSNVKSTEGTPTVEEAQVTASEAVKLGPSDNITPESDSDFGEGKELLVSVHPKTGKTSITVSNSYGTDIDYTLEERDGVVTLSKGKKDLMYSPDSWDSVVNRIRKDSKTEEPKATTTEEETASSIVTPSRTREEIIADQSAVEESSDNVAETETEEEMAADLADLIADEKASRQADYEEILYNDILSSTPPEVSRDFYDSSEQEAEPEVTTPVVEEGTTPKLPINKPATPVEPEVVPQQQRQEEIPVTLEAEPEIEPKAAPSMPTQKPDMPPEAEAESSSPEAVILNEGIQVIDAAAEIIGPEQAEGFKNALTRMIDQSSNVEEAGAARETVMGYLDRAIKNATGTESTSGPSPITQAIFQQQQQQKIETPKAEVETETTSTEEPIPTKEEQTKKKLTAMSGKPRTGKSERGTPGKVYQEPGLRELVDADAEGNPTGYVMTITPSLNENGEFVKGSMQVAITKPDGNVETTEVSGNANTSIKPGKEFLKSVKDKVEAAEPVVEAEPTVEEPVVEEVVPPAVEEKKPTQMVPPTQQRPEIPSTPVSEQPVEAKPIVPTSKPKTRAEEEAEKRAADRKAKEEKKVVDHANGLSEFDFTDYTDTFLKAANDPNSVIGTRIASYGALPDGDKKDALWDRLSQEFDRINAEMVRHKQEKENPTPPTPPATTTETSVPLAPPKQSSEDISVEIDTGPTASEVLQTGFEDAESRMMDLQEDDSLDAIDRRDGREEILEELASKIVDSLPDTPEGNALGKEISKLLDQEGPSLKKAEALITQAKAKLEAFLNPPVAKETITRKDGKVVEVNPETSTPTRKRGYDEDLNAMKHHRGTWIKELLPEGVADQEKGAIIAASFNEKFEPTPEGYQQGKGQFKSFRENLADAIIASNSDVLDAKKASAFKQEFLEVPFQELRSMLEESKKVLKHYGVSPDAVKKPEIKGLGALSQNDGSGVALGEGDFPDQRSKEEGSDVFGQAPWETEEDLSEEVIRFAKIPSELMGDYAISDGFYTRGVTDENSDQVANKFREASYEDLNPKDKALKGIINLIDTSKFYSVDDNESYLLKLEGTPFVDIGVFKHYNKEGKHVSWVAEVENEITTSGIEADNFAFEGHHFKTKKEAEDAARKMALSSLFIYSANKPYTITPDVVEVAKKGIEGVNNYLTERKKEQAKRKGPKKTVSALDQMIAETTETPSSSSSNTGRAGALSSYSEEPWSGGRGSYSTNTYIDGDIYNIRLKTSSSGNPAVSYHTLGGTNVSFELDTGKGKKSVAQLQQLAEDAVEERLNNTFD